MTSFIIEHQCPQCGAPAELEESDRLFRCGFCRAGSFLTADDYFRYVLPTKAPAGTELFYFPYWRFKGMCFSCLPQGIQKRFIDISHQAVPTPNLPASVGFRSQTQKLRFATSQIQGTFLKPQTSAATMLDLVTHRLSAELPKPVLHQAYIGENLSLLYAPFYVQENMMMDAILNKPVSDGDAVTIQPLLRETEAPRWPLNFIGALCPQCGWDLNGERDALVLTCTNCQTLWQAKQNRFVQLKAAHVPAQGEDWVYMPFWRLRADISGIRLAGMADLIRVANLAKIAQPGWDQLPFHFWSPAFKIRPQNFLTLATHVTLAQPRPDLQAGLPAQSMRAVTLPLHEAVESLKLNLASFMRPRKRLAELLPDIQIKARRFLLVYLPFREGHHELIHSGLKLAISKNLLAHSKNL